MPTSDGTAQKVQHRIVSDGKALLVPYAPKRSEDGKNLKNLLINSDKYKNKFNRNFTRYYLINLFKNKSEII